LQALLAKQQAAVVEDVQVANVEALKPQLAASKRKLLQLLNVCS
jgi:hypothetical protein